MDSAPFKFLPGAPRSASEISLHPAANMRHRELVPVECEDRVWRRRKAPWSIHDEQLRTGVGGRAMGLGVVRHLVTDAGREDELAAIRQLGVQLPLQT